VLNDEKNDDSFPDQSDRLLERHKTGRRPAKAQQRRVPAEGQQTNSEFELELRSTLA
jgi:hypothetical protein